MLAREKINLLLNGKATMKEIKELEEQEKLELEKDAEEKKTDEADKEPAEDSKEDNDIDYKKLYEELIAKKNSEDEEEPDYKALYEAEQKKVKEMQNKNAKKVIGEEETPTVRTANDVFADWIKQSL